MIDGVGHRPLRGAFRIMANALNQQRSCLMLPAASTNAVFERLDFSQPLWVRHSCFLSFLDFFLSFLDLFLSFPSFPSPIPS